MREKGPELVTKSVRFRQNPDYGTNLVGFALLKSLLRTKNLIYNNPKVNLFSFYVVLSHFDKTCVSRDLGFVHFVPLDLFNFPALYVCIFLAIICLITGLVGQDREGRGEVARRRQGTPGLRHDDKV